MYDEFPPRVKPLWWEGIAGSGYAFVAVLAPGLVYRSAREDGAPAWLWVLFAGITVAFFIGGVIFVRWAGRRRRAVRGREEPDAAPPSR